MATVSVRRELDVDGETVRERVHDVEAFMRAAGFDEVRRDGRRVGVSNSVGPVTIELELDLYDDPDAELAYRQRECIFESMNTTYAVTDAGDATVVAAQTGFSFDVAVVGSALDATVIKRQRRRELNAQLDYLERGRTNSE
jgi:hypothetical protein